jgi:antitoxin ParD1/3/4
LGAELRGSVLSGLVFWNVVMWQSLPLRENSMTLNVSLPLELEARVRAHVASGLYGSASEVIREALRLFEAYQSVQQSSLAALKADIDQGMADLDAGRVSKMDMAAIKAQGRALKKRR